MIRPGNEESALNLRIEEARREVDELRRRLNAVDISASSTGTTSAAVLALSTAGLSVAQATGDLALADYRVGYYAAGAGAALLLFSLFQSVIARMVAEEIPQSWDEVPGSHADDRELSSVELRQSVVAIHLCHVVDLGRLLRSKQRMLQISAVQLIFGAFLLTGSMLSFLLAE